MTSPYKFRRIQKRDDIDDIKKKSSADSVPCKETGDSWNTLYNDTYVRHPIEWTQAAKAPPEGFHVGGGNLAPTKEEMTSNYSQFFKGFDRTDVPPIAKPVPESDIIKGDEPIPMSTCHAALTEANEGRPPYDNTEAKERLAEGRSHHFYFGDDSPNFNTTYKDDYIKRKNDNPSVIDNALQASHITFDANAGLGPHTRAMGKKGKFPTVADATLMDQKKRNFDVGYDGTNYQTTMQASFAARNSKRPETFKAPPCAVLSDHGDQAGPWQTLYSTDFKNRGMIPNEIDKADLRATHFDPGHERNEWPSRTHEVPTVRPPLRSVNLQESNVVFRGDGEGRYQTTAGDLIGVFDRTKDGRGEYVNAREDHLFLGGDSTDYESTAKAANRHAGEGSPAKPSADLHLMRGTGFATGGTFGAHYGEDAVEMKPTVGGGRAAMCDPRYFTGTHFSLEATAKNKGRWKTTYYEDICRPTLA